ncbi:RNA polymerase sigma factor [Membranihabitans maritimus]|uniref:RNA polymerase sigma factor n=1 Tax=Membranihabitans maritimus TaxID=2904244 RepID=UPI001F026185|nr:sigma-70 family RNA polymerase sigma factor [Membranihabitans maritimus]
MKRKDQYQELSDKELCANMQSGDPVSFSCIYERYWDALYRKAFQRLQEESSSKDVVQNVFIDLWKRRNKLKIQNLRSYLYGAVRFQVYKHIDKSKKCDFFFEPFDQMMVSPIQTDGDIIRDDLAKLLALWIEALPEKRREIFVLHYQKQLSVSEIASELDITQKTVYNQLNNSIKELQWRLARFTAILAFLHFVL